MAAGRTLHVRCQTWDQVEQFHTRKLRRGKLLSMKVPFDATIGSPVTLGLELPNGVTIAIDGEVHKAAPIAGDTKTWIEVELVGFTDEVIARIRAMAADASAPATGAEPIAPKARSTHGAPAPTGARPTPRAATRPPGEERPADERELFQHLTAELKRMRQAAVHDVLGVASDAGAETIRRAWVGLVRRHHPDLVVRRRAPAISHLAEELTILANRAYDRLRSTIVADGRGVALGASVKSAPGWLVGFDDLASGNKDRLADAAVAAPVAPRGRNAVASIPPPVNGAPAAADAQGGDMFENRARTMLGQGDADSAQEVLAAALVVYPRSRALRSLFYVASAVSALGKGELMLATSQLETALAHYDKCSEAARLLDCLTRQDPIDRAMLGKVFG